VARRMRWVSGSEYEYQAILYGCGVTCVTFISRMAPHGQIAMS